jgi:hypothetical protein
MTPLSYGAATCRFFPGLGSGREDNGSGGVATGYQGKCLGSIGETVAGGDRNRQLAISELLRKRAQQHLVASQRPQLTHLDYLNPVTDPANPRYLHLSPPQAARGRNEARH